MSASAKKYGIDKFIYPEIGPQLTLVDQTGCTYNNTVKAVENDDVYTLKMNALEQTTLEVAIESSFVDSNIN